MSSIFHLPMSSLCAVFVKREREATQIDKLNIYSVEVGKTLVDNVDSAIDQSTSIAHTVSLGRNVSVHSSLTWPCMCGTTVHTELGWPEAVVAASIDAASCRCWIDASEHGSTNVPAKESLLSLSHFFCGLTFDSVVVGGGGQQLELPLINQRDGHCCNKNVPN